MENTKQKTTGTENTNRYLNSYYRLNKTLELDRYDVDLSNAKLGKRLHDYLGHITIVKTIQSRNLVIQKRETGNAYSFRIAIGRKAEPRFVSRISGEPQRVILFIKPKGKSYIEIFICTGFEGDSYAFLKLLEDGELESEIKYHRLKYVSNKPESVTPSTA